jgi:hypothetical protein
MAQKRITGIFSQTINELIVLIEQKDREIKEHKRCITDLEVTSNAINSYNKELKAANVLLQNIINENLNQGKEMLEKLKKLTNNKSNPPSFFNSN